MSAASKPGSKPRLLDLYCGAGGASMGYARAGFSVFGVDIKPQPHYPFKFFLADALEFIKYGEPFDVDAIHASPPCQRYSTATKRNGTQDAHPDLIAETRELLEETGLPYVIENVVGAPLHEPSYICGSERGLIADGHRLRRHRAFETNWGWKPHPNWETNWCMCEAFALLPVLDITGGGPTHKPRTDGGGGRPYKGTADQARRIMGIDWMTKAELNEAIPPAYTEFIGAQLLSHISQTEMAAASGL